MLKNNHDVSFAITQVLKEELRMRFPDQVFTYSCRADGISQQFGKQRVSRSYLFYPSLSDFLVQYLLYPHPPEAKLGWGVVVYIRIRLSVCPSVDGNLSGQLLLQFSTDLNTDSS